MLLATGHMVLIAVKRADQGTMHGFVSDPSSAHLRM